MIAVSFGLTHKKNQGFLILVKEYETLSDFRPKKINNMFLRHFF